MTKRHPLLGVVFVSRGGPLDGRLRCGSGIYTHAICVSVDPFVLVSEEGDMRWDKVREDEVVALCEAHPSAQKKAFARLERDQLEEKTLEVRLPP